MKIVCPNCGAKTSAKMNYCGKCGSALREVKAAEVTEEIVEGEEV